VPWETVYVPAVPVGSKRMNPTLQQPEKGAVCGSENDYQKTK